MGLDGCIELGQGNTQASAVGVDNKIDVSQWKNPKSPFVLENRPPVSIRWRLYVWMI